MFLINISLLLLEVSMCILIIESVSNFFLVFQYFTYINVLLIDIYTAIIIMHPFLFRIHTIVYISNLPRPEKMNLRHIHRRH
jgi:hypothetical protein